MPDGSENSSVRDPTNRQGSSTAVHLCGNQNFTARSCIVASTSTPSTRRLLDSVAMPVPAPLNGANRAASSPRNDLVKNYRVHPTHWLISTQASLASSPNRRCRALCRRSARSCSRTTATTWRRLSRSTSSTRRPLLEEIDDEDVTGTAEDACRPRGGVGSA